MVNEITIHRSRLGRRTRRLIPFQFGNYLLPRIQYSSETSWKFRQTTGESSYMADGAIDLASSAMRAPLSLGEMTCSGKYATVRGKRDVCIAESELSGVFSTSGVWTPLMVYVEDDTGEDDCVGCGLISDKSGRWMWTWARVEEPRIKSDTDGVLKGVNAAEFTFSLREPFMEADAAHWRFGSPPPIQFARTYKEGEQLVSAGNSRRPKSMPDCDVTERWYFRDPFACIDTSCLCYYGMDCLWGTRNYRFEGKGSFGMLVPGNFEAIGYIRAETNCLFRIINDTYFIQEHTLLKGETIDLVRKEVYAGCVPKNVNTTRFPRITPGVNRIEFVGDVTVGVMPRWLF